LFKIFKYIVVSFHKLAMLHHGFNKEKCEEREERGGGRERERSGPLGEIGHPPYLDFGKKKLVYVYISSIVAD
jgi:hypothetical protein